ncbi:MAG: L,D-transpeptidase family protein [Hymenobacteraceae bacterium]|mgnify:CR=1 FL=1|nr:L,D-transpeptidase family protein [Hymenobacteraceae bacterium]
MLRLFLILCFSLNVGGAMAQEQQAKLLPYREQGLQEAIRRYEAIVKSDSWHSFPDTLLLKPGDSSRYVLPLQENLVLTGDLHLNDVADSALYVPAVAAAVKRFQKRHGLVTDGIVGPNTVAALNVPPATRLWQLQRSLSRWSSHGTDTLQQYVVINIPDYTLHLIDSGRVELQMRVILGKPALKTYPVVSELNMVVLHPYWYVPTSIAVNEIVPILRRNPGYLSRKGMRLEEQTSRGWQSVSPWQVDWSSINSANFNYRIVQLNGSQNELGQVKFPFPNRIAQYLHDTPGKELFNYPKRAFSHGCIRVEKPVELAYYLLERGSGYSVKKVERLWRRQKPNHYIQVRNPVPLYIIYLTAWMDENLQVQFREDVYGYDQPPQQLTKE